MPKKISPRFSPSVLSPLPKLAKCWNLCSMFSFFSTAMAWFIRASSLPTFSPPPINSSLPATLSFPSANPANHRARWTRTTLLNPRLLRSPLPPTSGLSAWPWSKRSRSTHLPCNPEAKPTRSSPIRFLSLSSTSPVMRSAANPGGAGPFAISRRASIPRPSALLPPNPFLLWLFRCHPFLLSPRQSCKSQSSTHLRQGRKRNPRVRKPRTLRGKLSFSPTMSFLLRLRFLLSSRSSRCRKSLAIVPTPLRPLQRPLPRLRRSQNRSSSLRVVKPRQHQSRPHQLQRKTRSRPPLRKILWHSHSVRRLPHPPVLLCARIPFRPQTRQALPRHLPRAVKSSNRFCPRSPRRLAPPFKASCASASACTSTPQAMLLKPRSILVAPVSILPTLLSKPPAAGNSLLPKWAVTASPVIGSSASSSRQPAPRPFQSK